MLRGNLQSSVIFFVGSVTSACVGGLLFIICFGIQSTLLSWLCLLFTLTAFVLGVIAIIKIRSQKIICIIELVLLILAAYFLLGFCLSDYLSSRMLKSISLNLKLQIQKIGGSFSEYFEKNDYLPDANNWCYSLVKNDSEIDEYDFRIGQLPKIECNFAFNKDISNLSKVNLSENVVLIFEANGELNLSGSSGLIGIERAKDKYFRFKKQRFIYVLFIDGTIVKYRLHDGAVALYNPEKDKTVYLDKDEFTDYFEKGQTPYSPLRWK